MLGRLLQTFFDDLDGLALLPVYVILRGLVKIRVPCATGGFVLGAHRLRDGRRRHEAQSQSDDADAEFHEISVRCREGKRSEGLRHRVDRDDVF